VHRGVQDERVDSAIPDGMHEADELARAECADPGQTVALQPACPRAGNGVCIWEVRAERPVIASTYPCWRVGTIEQAARAAAWGL
jgi:hypothetical protein